MFATGLCGYAHIFSQCHWEKKGKQYMVIRHGSENHLTMAGKFLASQWWSPIGVNHHESPMMKPFFPKTRGVASPSPGYRTASLDGLWQHKWTPETPRFVARSFMGKTGKPTVFGHISPGELPIIFRQIQNLDENSRWITDTMKWRLYCIKL